MARSCAAPRMTEDGMQALLGACGPTGPLPALFLNLPAREDGTAARSTAILLRLRSGGFMVALPELEEIGTYLREPETEEAGENAAALYPTSVLLETPRGRALGEGPILLADLVWPLVQLFSRASPLRSQAMGEVFRFTFEDQAARPNRQSLEAMADQWIHETMDEDTAGDYVTADGGGDSAPEPLLAEQHEVNDLQQRVRELEALLASQPGGQSRMGAISSTALRTPPRGILFNQAGTPDQHSQTVATLRQLAGAAPPRLGAHERGLRENRPSQFLETLQQEGAARDGRGVERTRSSSDRSPAEDAPSPNAADAATCKAAREEGRSVARRIGQFRDKWGRVRHQGLPSPRCLCEACCRCFKSRGGRAGQRCSGAWSGSSPDRFWAHAGVPRKEGTSGRSPSAHTDGLHVRSGLGARIPHQQPRSHGSCSPWDVVHRPSSHGLWTDDPGMAPDVSAGATVFHHTKKQKQSFDEPLHSSCRTFMDRGKCVLHEGLGLPGREDQECQLILQCQPQEGGDGGRTWSKEAAVEEEETEAEGRSLRWRQRRLKRKTATGSLQSGSTPLLPSSLSGRRECIPTINRGRGVEPDTAEALDVAGDEDAPQVAKSDREAGRDAGHHSTRGLINVQPSEDILPPSTQCTELVCAVLQVASLPGAFQRFASKSLKEFRAAQDGPVVKRTDLWPCPPPRWRRWTGSSSLSPTRRKRHRLLETRALCVQQLVLALNWLSLGHSETPPIYARAGYPMSAQQLLMVERLEDLVSYFLDAPADPLDSLGRAGEKLTSLGKLVFKMHDPSTSFSVEDLSSFLDSIQSSFDSYSRATSMQSMSPSLK